MQSNLKSGQAVSHLALLDLVAIWAHGARLPPNEVLCRICDWAVKGAFPPETFVNQLGEAADLFETWAVSRAWLTKDGIVRLAKGAALGIDPWEAKQRLREIRVSRKGALAFGEKTGTVPPRILLHGVPRPLVFLRRRHRAPPPCPDPYIIDEVTRHYEQDTGAWAELPVDLPQSTKLSEPSSGRGKGSNKGRPIGTAPYRKRDMEIVAKMKKVISKAAKRGHTMSPTAAANQFLDKVEGASETAKRARLVDLYNHPR
jgi:hypothetical protein